MKYSLNIRILREKMPKAFMLENVRNLTAHDGGKTFKVIRTHLESLGYKINLFNFLRGISTNTKIIT